MKYCQGVKCHTYRTKDRIRGTKGKKYYQTRRRSNFYYLGGNACSMACERDWFNKFGEQAINHFGRIVEPIKLTVETAWVKCERYFNPDHEPPYYWYNRVSEQQLPLTEEQFNNPNLISPNSNQTNNLSQ